MDALGKPHCEMLLLWVNLSSVKMRDEVPIALVPLTSSLPPSSMQPATKYPYKAATIMTTEIQELLSQAMLDTLVLAPERTTPRRLP